MRITQLLTLPLFGLALTAQARQQTIIVSPDGSDRGDGTLRKPFQTVQYALSKAATLKGDTVHIRLRGGTYTLDRSVDFNGASQITISPWNGEKVSFVGGTRIKSNQLQKVTDPAIRERLRPEVRDRIRQIDAKALGIELTDLIPKGFYRPSLPSWSELFIDGKPMNIARWPNDSTAPIGKIHCTGDIPRTNTYGIGDPVFEYAEDGFPIASLNGPVGLSPTATPTT